MKYNSLFNILFFVLAIGNLEQSFAQAIGDTNDISNMSLEDLMKYKSQGIASVLETKINSSVEVGSAKPLVSRKSASIISIISDEEIQRSGARDLMDVLNLVPGINFNIDVEGGIGISIRGNWANEGKVLMLIDGQEMNETVYGTLQFGNRYPVDQIKRIEIIRGPGSAIYGGAAEYAVINIIMKTANEIAGLQANIVYGRTQNAFARNNYSLALGKKIKDFNFSVIGFAGNANKSDRNYADINGTQWNMANNSEIKPLNFNVGASYKSLSFRFLYDYYRINASDGFDVLSNNKYIESFKTMIAEIKYEWKLKNNLTIIPKFSYKHNSPWEVSSFTGTDTVEASDFLYKTEADRYKLNITGIWETSRNITTTLGVEGFFDNGTKSNGDVFRKSESSNVSYTNAACFAQSVFKNKIANVILGARYDNNNSFGSAFVPRVGLTKRFDKFNLKLLYSSSFKSPSIENVESSLIGGIKPEKTNIWELEAGYQLNSDMFLTANVFDISTQNPIVYFVDTSSSNTGVPDGYINVAQSGTQGFELEYKFVSNWGYFNLNYSYYSAANKPKVSIYENPYSKEQLLGIDNHKLSINASFNVTKNIYVSPSLIYHSEKTGITGIDEEENYIYEKLPETFAVNLNLGCVQLFTKAISASIGVYNLLDQKLVFVQPYASGHAPLPGMSREFLVRFSYKFNHN